NPPKPPRPGRDCRALVRVRIAVAPSRPVDLRFPLFLRAFAHSQLPPVHEAIDPVTRPLFPVAAGPPTPRFYLLPRAIRPRSRHSSHCSTRPVPPYLVFLVVIDLGEFGVDDVFIIRTFRTGSSTGLGRAGGRCLLLLVDLLTHLHGSVGEGLSLRVDRIVIVAFKSRLGF